MNLFTNIKQKFNTSFGKNKAKKDGSGKFKEFIAKLSKGLMLPIAILPIAGLFLGIGAAISGQAPTSDGAQAIIGKIISTPGDIIFGSLPALFAVAIAIAFTGDVGVPALAAVVGWLVFNAFQSSLIVNHENSVQFLYWHFEDNTWLDSLAFKAIFGANLGIASMNTGVFGGMVVGGLAAFLYNKFKNIQLPTLLGFFSGARFIPIITFLTAIGTGLVFAMVWPLFGMAFFYIGKGLTAAPGGLNSLLFGFFNRVLVPFGLHHVFNTLMWFSNVGGTFDTNQVAYVFVDGHYYVAQSAGAKWYEVMGSTSGKSVVGDIYIYLEMMKLVGKQVTLVPLDSAPAHQAVTLTFDMIFKGTAKTSADGLITCNPGQYTTGAYVFSLFALPAAALAMVMSTPKGDNRKVATSIVASAGAVCFLTGITEPIEFTFLFLAPALYWGFHAVMSAIGWMLCTMLSLYAPAIGPHIGFSFSSGFLDFSIYGIIADAVGGKSNTFTPLLLSAIWGVIYYFVFYWAINKWNIQTPGRGENTKLFSKKDYLDAKASKLTGTTKPTPANNKSSKDAAMRELSLKVVDAYGGLKNIRNVDACITKLRIEVNDPAIVNKDELMKLGARGVLKPAPRSVYSVFGTTADRIKNEIKDIQSGK